MGKWNKDYNKERRYNPAWENEFKWLTLKDGQCFCKWCDSFLSSMRRSNFCQHRTARKHLNKVPPTEVEDFQTQVKIDFNNQTEDFVLAEPKSSKYKSVKEFKDWLFRLEDDAEHRYCIVCHKKLLGNYKNIITHTQTKAHRIALDETKPKVENAIDSSDDSLCDISVSIPTSYYEEIPQQIPIQIYPEENVEMHDSREEPQLLVNCVVELRKQLFNQTVELCLESNAERCAQVSENINRTSEKLKDITLMCSDDQLEAASTLCADFAGSS